MSFPSKVEILNDEEIRSYLRKKSQPSYIPASVYRLQFNAQFTFEDAANLIPYLKKMGIHAIYASPYLEARPGSTHGYDIANPLRLNPEIGDEASFQKLTDALKTHGMGQMLDVVPNHMGIIGNNNPWWLDVLENGPGSAYADFFDINWSPKKSELKNKVLLPLLEDHFGKVLEQGKLQLIYEKGNFSIHYYLHRFPISPHTYPLILEQDIGDLESQMSEEEKDWHEFLSVITAFKNLPGRLERDPSKIAERTREKNVSQERLAALTQRSEAVRSFINKKMKIFNGQIGRPASFDLFEILINEQSYRLGYWNVASEEINYRRFFDINELVALRMEDERVFETYHRFIYQLILDGKIQGLRIDHPDGLYDPPSYFRRLQVKYLLQRIKCEFGYSEEQFEIEQNEIKERLDRILKEKEFASLSSFLIMVEKILDRKETLPEDWNVSGTVGYEYLTSMDGIFVRQDSKKDFDEIYENFIGTRIEFDQLMYEKKKFFGLVHMASEISTLAQQLDEISERNRHYRDFTLYNIIVAIREVIACFPVYRTYISPETQKVSERDEKYIHIAVEKAKRKTLALPHALYDFLRDILLLRLSQRTPEDERLYRHFILRFQQLTGPIMAKGLEDTAFYAYNRLISLNEVGGDPTHFGNSPSEFHKDNLERSKKWPANLLALSTHDTKRSEDVRMRIHALSEMPEEWKLQLQRWAQANQKHKTLIDTQMFPQENLEYYIYQSLLGVWPNEAMSAEAYEVFKERFWNSILKAAREAKTFTNWVNPNREYEEAVKKFVFSLLSQEEDNPFFKYFIPFQKRIARLGMLNSLSALTLKVGSPGVSDTYQGSELWNYSLVDPDNRRPVDYEIRSRYLNEMGEKTGHCVDPMEITQDYFKHWEDGKIKLYLLSQGLQWRQKASDLLIFGDYVPLKVEGKQEKHLVAFLRRFGERFALVAAARLFHELLPEEEEDLIVLPQIWDDTRILLPADIQGSISWKDLYTGKKLNPLNHSNETSILAADIFNPLSTTILINS